MADDAPDTDATPDTVTQPGSRRSRLRRRQKGQRPEQSGWRQALDLVVTVIIIVAIIFGIESWVARPFKVPSGSMIPTLKIGQRIIAERLSDHYHVGQVVVFHPPLNATTEDTCASNHSPSTGCDQSSTQLSNIYFVKRIVGDPGDHLKIIAGQVYRNGQREPDSYINRSTSLPPGERASDCPICNEPTTITVPAGEYYMMGDNRGDSDDSRIWGPVPKRAIIGPVIASYWPLSRIQIGNP
jgi:signal peptidase I